MPKFFLSIIDTYIFPLNKYLTKFYNYSLKYFLYISTKINEFLSTFEIEKLKNLSAKFLAAPISSLNFSYFLYFEYFIVIKH
jgi:hypothetical protein